MSACPTWIDESSGGVYQEAESAEGRLAFDTRDDVVRQANRFQRRAEDKLAWVQDERLAVADFDGFHQVSRFVERVDHFAGVVAED